MTGRLCKPVAFPSEKIFCSSRSRCPAPLGSGTALSGKDNAFSGEESVYERFRKIVERIEGQPILKSPGEKMPKLNSGLMRRDFLKTTIAAVGAASLPLAMATATRSAKHAPYSAQDTCGERVKSAR